MSDGPTTAHSSRAANVLPPEVAVKSMKQRRRRVDPRYVYVSSADSGIQPINVA